MLGGLGHVDKVPQFYALGVGFYFPGGPWILITHPLEFFNFSVGVLEGDMSVGIDDGRALQVFENRLLAGNVSCIDEYLNPGAVLLVLPDLEILLYHVGAVLLGVEYQAHPMSHFLFLCL